MVLHSCFGNRKSGSIPTFSTKPYDAASVHVVALLSSMVLGITQNCPSGYSGLAQRFVYMALTHVKVVRPHHPLPKPKMGVHVNPPIKWRSSSSVVLGKTMELLPHFL